MKIRNGFVSNSSSSSFLLLTTVENYERAKANLTKFQLAVAEQMKTEAKVFGRDMVSFETWNNQGCNWTEDFWVEGDLEEDPEANPKGEDVRDAFDSFETEVKKGPKDEYYTKSIDTG
jgi:hypothetical protein